MFSKDVALLVHSVQFQVICIRIVIVIIIICSNRRYKTNRNVKIKENTLLR